MKVKRESWLEAAKQAAKYSIPAVMPEESELTKSRNKSTLKSPNQSIVADGINNLASKVTLTMLPPNQTFYRFKMDDAVIKSNAKLSTEDEKKFWSVSLSAIVYRLNKLNLITEWQYRTLVIEMNKMSYNVNEPYPIPKENSQILNKVFKSLTEDNISINDIAIDLNLSVKELKKLILGIAEIEGGNKGIAQQNKANLHVVK